MIAQRRKSIETGVVGSEKLAGLSHAAERAWWRLLLSTDHYGTIDVTDLRRLRLAILGEVDGFGSNEALQHEIDVLIGAGLLVQWSEPWQEKDRTFLHVVNNDERQTDSFLRDRNRSKSRTSPVPPFDCCSHEAEYRGNEALSAATDLRRNAAHCGALRGIAAHVSNPAPQADAPQCAASPRARKLKEAASEAGDIAALVALVEASERRYATILDRSIRQAEQIDYLIDVVPADALDFQTIEEIRNRPGPGSARPERLHPDEVSPPAATSPPQGAPDQIVTGDAA